MEQLQLRKFQKEDVAFIRENRYRVLIANAPGTGKTIECLACIGGDRTSLIPAIVVCPPSVSHNWRREAKKWCPWAKVYIVKGLRTPLPRQHVDLIIVPWSILADRYLELMGRSPKLLIVDEAHFAKNEETLRSQALHLLARSCEKLLLLTGTPLINNERELTVLRGLFGVDNPPMIRRFLEDVAKDIPPKTRSLLPVTLRRKERADYDRAENDFEAWLDQELKRRLGEGEAEAAAHRAMAAEALVKIGYLRRILAAAKTHAAAEWVRNAVLLGEGVVVFLEHREPLRLLQKLLRKQRIGCVVVEGATSPKERLAAVDSFQAGDVPVFIGTKAAKEGITLHRARHLLFLERYFTSAEEEQAEDRIRRIGQKYPTTMWFLHGVNTIDDRLAQIIDSKRRLVDSVVGSPDVNESEQGAVLDLISSWGKHTRSEMDPTALGHPRSLPALPSPAVVCSLMFGVKRWTPKAAQIWARMNGYHAARVHQRGHIVRVDNHNPALFEKGTFKTVTLASDVRAVIGTRKVRRRSTRSSGSRRTRPRKQ
jgi:SWI/SNF-related matrix-associated actin-dependent regulator 1 of chromatin subfamily A